MPRPRKRSERSKLREARQALKSTRTELAGANSQLDNARATLSDYEGLLADVRRDRDSALTRAGEAEVRLTEANTELSDLRTAFRMISAELDDLHGRLMTTLDHNNQQCRDLLDTRGKLRQMRALATVTAVKAMMDVTPAEAVALLTSAAVHCEVDPEDVVAASQTILPNAYRLATKAILEVSAEPSVPTDISDILATFQEMGIHPARV